MDDDKDSVLRLVVRHQASYAKELKSLFKTHTFEGEGRSQRPLWHASSNPHSAASSFGDASQQRGHAKQSAVDVRARSQHQRLRNVYTCSSASGHALLPPWLMLACSHEACATDGKRYKPTYLLLEMHTNILSFDPPALSRVPEGARRGRRFAPAPAATQTDTRQQTVKSRQEPDRRPTDRHTTLPHTLKELLPWL